MKNLIFKSSFNEKLKLLIIPMMLLTLGVGQMWGGTPYMSGFGIQFRDDGGAWFKTGTKDDCSSGVMDCDFGSKTNLKIVYIYANGNKNGGNLCGDNYFKYEIYGTTGTANWGGTNRKSCTWNGSTPTYKWGTENSSTAWIDLVKDRKPGDYRMEFYMSFNGNTSSDGCSGWYDCKYNSGNWKFSWSIPDPTITITGASSLVVGTSTNIKATITNYPVGATVTKVRVSGNIASAMEQTGSAANLTVSSVVPNASGTNGITVTVTVTYGTAGTVDYTYYYNVSPPAVSGFSVSEANHLAGDGTSTSTPYILPYNGTLSLSLTGSQAATDANSAAQYYNTSSNNAWSTTSTKSINNITTTSNCSTTVKMRYKHSTASLTGAASSKTIYYKSETRYDVKAVASPAAGGTVTPTSNTAMGQYSGGTITASENTGYTFTGWTGGTGTFTDATAPSTTFKPTAASTVTANFSENMSTVSLVADPTGKGTFTIGGAAATSTTAGVTTTRSVTAVPISGYSFDSWSISGGATISSTSDNPVTVTGDGTGDDATLTATFVENPVYYTITYGAGSNGSVAEDHSYASGSSQLANTSISITATPATHYKLEGWYSNSGLTIPIAGAGTTNPYSFLLTDNTSVYAKFVIKQCTITLDGNGGSNQSVTATHGSTLPSFTASSRTGYTLTGYWTGTSGGTKIINADGSLVASTDYANGSKQWNNDATTLTLHAQWTANSYDVALNANGGTGAGVTVSATYGSNMPTKDKSNNSLVKPTKAGYTFAGYYDDPTGGTQYYTSALASARTWNKASTATLYAHWTARPYKTVYFALPQGWTNVYAYAWKNSDSSKKNATYPGVQLNSGAAGTGTVIKNGVTYYYYKYYTDGLAGDTEGNGTGYSNSPNSWDRVIFANSSLATTAGTNKTYDLTISNGHYYWLNETSGTGLAAAAEWYVEGTWPGHSWDNHYPVVFAENARSGSVLIEGLTASTSYSFKIFRANANGEWYKYTGGAGVSYDADKDITSDIGNELTLRVYNNNNNTFTTATTSYRFTLDVTNVNNPVLVVSPGTDNNYSATLSVNSFGHGSTTPAAGAITLHQYTPTTITANPEAGYRFKQWNKNANVSYAAGYSSTSNPCQFLGTANGGTIEAEFTQDGMIYFDNTMSQWKGDIYVYIFTMDKSTRDPWWNSKDGSGNGPGIVLKKKDGTVMYQYYGKMTRIGESNIYYFNYHAAGCSSTIYQVVFTKGDYHESAGLYQTSAAYRSDFNSCFPMYLASQSWTTTNSTGYHSSGYWKRYNVTNSGFSISGLNSDWTTHYEFTAASANSNTFKATVHLSNNTHSFKIFRCSGSELGNNGTMTPSSHSGWEMTPGTNNCQIEAPSGGDYEFTINIGTDHIYLSVEYPLLANDYHLLYVGRITTDGSDSHRHPSQSIRHLTGSNKTQRDTVSFFIDKDHKGTLKLQKCTNPASYGGTGAWADSAAVTVNLSSISETGIYNFEIIQITNAAGKRTVTAALLDAAHRKYNGELYIRTDMADGGWEAYKEVDNNKLVYSDYAKAHSGYDYYHCHWSSTGTNVHFTIANQYSPSITDTMKQGAAPFNFENLPYQASTRFMYNSATNKISRAYINGSSEEGEATYLWLQGTSAGTSRILNTSGSPFTGNKVKFGDDGNWIYRIDIKAEEAARIKLICNYRFSNTDHLQYFKGTSADWSNTSTEEILGGTSTSEAHPIRVIYDFKTNHLISAWLADGTNVNEPKAINTSVMVVREHQEDAKQITFTSTGKLTSVDTVYCVMQFNKWTINNKSKIGDHPALSPSLSTHERGLYWVSFPFNVKLNDVFGFGEYGTNWIIEYYDGKGRAEKGFWAESPVNWKFVDPSERATYVLKANEGYVLALDLETMTESSKVWEYVENVSLYFPSSTAVGNIIKKDVSVTIDQTGYECTINRTVDANNNPTGLPADYDRRKRDSYWHCIGVPSFANNTHDIKADAFIKDVSDEYYYPSTWSAANLPFYYKWDPATNAISPYSTGSSLEFKAMNSYLVQYSGTSLSWSSVTTPSASSIVGRKAKKEDVHFAEFKLELMQGEENVDHTFVRLTDNEEATKEFEFGQDLCKEFNKKSNIYTLIGDLQVAGNSMPLEYEKTTLVPVGVKIVADGEYIITMPEGTNGIGVTLIDNELQTRTNLALTDYAVTLSAGTYDERFVLEISPIEQTTTGIEQSAISSQQSAIQKKLIDGVLYIVKDGKVFDARGARIQ